MKKLPFASAVICVSFAITGCGTLYKLDVTAYNNPQIEVGKSYVVLSGNPNVIGQLTGSFVPTQTRWRKRWSPRATEE